MKLKNIIAAIFSGTVAIAAAGSWFAYRYVFYSANCEQDIYAIPKGEQYQKNHSKMTSLIREMDKIPFEPVEIISFDGLKLRGRYYHVQDGAPVQIQCHGYHGNGLRDFCGGNKIAREMGQNTLVIDQRAHGKSEGHTITFGIKERFDCLSWVEYVCERFGEEVPIYLAGVSMGAATVLMTSELDLPNNVKAILADCTYSSPKAIIQKVCKDMKLPPKLVYPFVQLGAFLFGHFRLSDSSPAEAVKHAKIPILLIHGDADHFVPCDMSREIFEACASEKQMVTIPDAGHAISYIVDSEQYEQAVKTFLEKIS